MAIIRQANKDDVPRILELYEERLVIGTTEAELQQNPSEEDYEQVYNEINALPGCELIVAEENEEVIGTTMLMIVPNLSHKGLPWMVIENVVVDEKYRRKGIGKLMMEYCNSRAKEAGCYKVQLMSDKSRKEAHEFYNAIGYKASSEGFRLYL
ncbi:GNAT family N-acetyltransferase [Chloroflexota bacterium]